MSAQHTPGPWVVEDRQVYPQQNWVCINAPNGDPRFKDGPWEQLAVAYGAVDRPRIGAEIMRANAHLIAAAPEGLALAEHIAAMATDPYLCGHPEWEHIVAEAQALIAKATP